jgi:hypothetical protein
MSPGIKCSEVFVIGNSFIIVLAVEIQVSHNDEYEDGCLLGCITT